MTGSWVYGAVALLTVLHGMALLYAYRNGRRAVRTGATADADRYVTEEGVECPDCGTLNETEYRFCRRCVSELPGHVSFTDDSSAPWGRRTR